MLPIDIQMQIDITAQMHKREIAEGFAKLREKLLPEPARTLQDILMNAAFLPVSLQQLLAPAQNQNPFQMGLWNQAQNQDPGYLGGALHGCWQLALSP